MPRHQKTVLIVTERLDPHADFVQLELERRGIPWVRLHLSDVPAAAGGTLRVGEDGPVEGYLTIRGRLTPFATIGAVWYRRTESFDLAAIADAEMRRFAAAECRQFVRAIWAALAHASWVSSPEAIQGASTKLEQLVRARRLGFAVPRTLVGNDPAAVTSFVKELGAPGAVIYKPHTSLIVPQGDDGDVGVAYATPLSSALVERLDEIRDSPGIFQQRIAKRRDLRVTVFGDRVFAVAIDSQANNDTTEDWRAFAWTGPPPQHRPIELSPSVKQRCLELVRSYQLRFGAIDLIEDLEGRLWFLELNPNGQWAWIQQATGLPMREALVDTLVTEEASHETTICSHLVATPAPPLAEGGSPP